MNWFDASGLTSLAKNALKEAQKTIDKALDIQDESGDEQDGSDSADCSGDKASAHDRLQQESSQFVATWNLNPTNTTDDSSYKEDIVVTESPSKAAALSVWGSFAGSFFEQPKSDDSTIVRPPKAKSMNVISSTYNSQDDLFSKTQLVMSESEGVERKNITSLESPKVEGRRSSSRSNALSLVSSRYSSDSVEILSPGLITPESDGSVQSMSHSSSTSLKPNSESVEIVPDSLVSPSSIECIALDSYSERNSSSSSNWSTNLSDKKSTPIGDKTDKIETADSVSLVADDDDDTISYNSVSECTAPTVLDTDEKSVYLFQTVTVKTDSQRKIMDKDFVHLEQPLIPQKMQLSENSSNDGSWSDRTLNADNDSINLEASMEGQKKEVEQEDMQIDKLSDSSSFYNVHVSSKEMLRSDSCASINAEKQKNIEPDNNEFPQKDNSAKERISPISSDSKSDLVKIGSDHTSGDELETATSSDIEIIPSPNGDSGHSYCRSSPAKYVFKQSKFDGTTSPNLVELVLGKSLATKIRGHNRELSEASVQSNTSDESQGSENERLMKRLSEMAEILEAKENKLMEFSRNNLELVESNADLKIQVQTLLAKHETGDITMITEDYTQRLSALEKKFQQAIREKDQLRKQLDSIKTESSSRKNSSELENVLKEKDEVIAQLQEEGEKLARQQLQHSNIIKKLRAKEKDNEQVIKSLRDKVSEQTAELDRLKRAIAAKEELEVSQIEAVYRLTTANKKLDTELLETKSELDDTTQRLESSRKSLEAAVQEINELQRSGTELQRRRARMAQLEEDKETAEREAERLRREVHQLRAEMVQEERRWVGREAALRREVSEARELCAALEARGEAGGEAGVAALLAQLAALQRAVLERDQAAAVARRDLANRLNEAEQALAKAEERERVTREESAGLVSRAEAAESAGRAAQARLEAVSRQCTLYIAKANSLEEQLATMTSELDRLKADHEAETRELRARAADAETQLTAERDALHTEKKRSAILQEQVSARGDVSPPHSLLSDSLSSTLWPHEEGNTTPILGASGGHTTVSGPTTALCVDEALAQLTRRDGELRTLSAAHVALREERDKMRQALARLHAELDECRAVQEQYDALLQMYGEKEEQLAEVRLDLLDVTQLYKAQLDELVALKTRAGHDAR